MSVTELSAVAESVLEGSKEVTMSPEDERHARVDGLPDEVLHQVFSYLDLRDLLRCEVVCRRWLQLVRHPAVWRHVKVECRDGRIVYHTRSANKSHDYEQFMVSHGRVIRQLIIRDHTGDPYDRKYFLENCNDLLMLHLDTYIVNGDLVEFLTKHKKLRVLLWTVWIPRTADSEVYPVVPFDIFPHLHTLFVAGDVFRAEETKQSVLRCRLRDLYIDTRTSDYMDAQFLESVFASQRETLTRVTIENGGCFSELCVRQLAQCLRLKMFYVGETPTRLLQQFKILFPSFRIFIYREDPCYPRQRNIRGILK